MWDVDWTLRSSNPPSSSPSRISGEQWLGLCLTPLRGRQLSPSERSSGRCNWRTVLPFTRCSLLPHMQLLHMSLFPSLKIAAEHRTWCFLLFTKHTHMHSHTWCSQLFSGVARHVFWWKKWSSWNCSPMEEHPSYFPHKHCSCLTCISCVGGVEVPGAIWLELQFWVYHFLVTRPWASYVAFLSFRVLVCK